MRALLFLEWCYARNNTLAIVRSPGRLVLWSIYGLSLVLLGLTRLLRSHAAPAGDRVPLAHGPLLAVVGALSLFIGISIVLAAGGRFGAFRSPAEAILMSNAALRPLTIAVWLQVRKIAAGGARSLGGFFYAFIVFAPTHAGPAATARAFLATVLILGIPQAVGLPAFLLARGRGRLPIRAIGSLFALLGVGYLAAGASTALWTRILRATHFDPALIARAALRAEPLAFIVPLAIYAAFVLVVAWRGNDSLPEMFAAASASASVRARASRGAAGIERPRKPLRANHRERVPPGAGAILWKDWIVIRRTPRAVWLLLASALAWILGGVGTALATLSFEDSSLLSTFAFTVVLIITFWAPYSAAAGLASDLSKPLFWLSTASLRTRLAVWAFARSWRGGASLGCGAMAVALTLGRPFLAALCIPVVVIAYWSLNALGIGLYAFVPNPLDRGGPSVLIRFVASLAYYVPAASLAAGAAALRLGSFGTATVFALGLALQGWLVIELVAVRFTEYGASLARIESAT